MIEAIPALLEAGVKVIVGLACSIAAIMILIGFCCAVEIIRDIISNRQEL